MKRPLTIIIALFFLGILVLTQLHSYYPSSKLLEYSRYFPGQPIAKICTQLPYDYLNERYGQGYFICQISISDPVITSYGSLNTIETFTYYSDDLFLGDLIIAFGQPTIQRSYQRWIFHWYNGMASTGDDFSPLTHINGIYLWKRKQ